jgi:hypothetical protein
VEVAMGFGDAEGPDEGGGGDSRGCECEVEPEPCGAGEGGARGWPGGWLDEVGIAEARFGVVAVAVGAGHTCQYVPGCRVIAWAQDR